MTIVSFAQRAVLDRLQQVDEVVAAVRLARVAGVLVLLADGLTKLTGFSLHVVADACAVADELRLVAQVRGARGRARARSCAK